MRRGAKTGRAVVWAAALSLLPAAAEADLVVFTTGRTMSVASSHAEGGQLVVSLRGGGSALFPLAVVARVDPDEVPYPGSESPGTSQNLPGPAGPAQPVEPLRSRPYASLVEQAATTHGVDVRLVHAVIEAESNYEPRARSRKGARGLMQLMPATAEQYAVRDPYDPTTNIDAGVRHLKDLLSRFEVSLALAAYNAGEATIRRYGGMPPFPETKRYVTRILARLAQ
jgi:soluble lytic murein transglycosylase-like protein